MPDNRPGYAHRSNLMMRRPREQSGVATLPSNFAGSPGRPGLPEYNFFERLMAAQDKTDRAVAAPFLWGAEKLWEHGIEPWVEQAPDIADWLAGTRGTSAQMAPIPDLPIPDRSKFYSLPPSRRATVDAARSSDAANIARGLAFAQGQTAAGERAADRAAPPAGQRTPEGIDPIAMALLRGGLSMAASPSQVPLQALGEGGLAGVDTYIAIKQNQAEDALKKEELRQLGTYRQALTYQAIATGNAAGYGKVTSEMSNVANLMEQGYSLDDAVRLIYSDSAEDQFVAKWLIAAQSNPLLLGLSESEKVARLQLDLQLFKTRNPTGVPTGNPALDAAGVSKEVDPAQLKMNRE